MEIRVVGRGERFGRMAMRWIAIGLLALLALGATIDAASAKPSPGSYQNAFTNACRDHGGTPKRVGSRIVKCTLGDGTTITCDFNFNPPSCTTVQAAIGATFGNIAVSANGEIFVEVEPETTVPATRVTAARGGGATILVAMDDDQP